MTKCRAVSGKPKKSSFRPPSRNDEVIKGFVLFILLALTFTVVQAAPDYHYNGHLKYRSLLTNYPSDSLFQDFSDDPAWDNNADLRLNFSAYKNAWAAQLDYQLLTLAGDTVSMLQQNPGLGFRPQLITDDDHRLMDLTHIISEDEDSITAHRLDRLNLSYTTDQAVARVGRQAVSWGNGLIYNPMDFFNPFDPAAIDKEYKTGDDMIYGQYLFNNSNDLQAVWVGRRDDNGDVSSEVASSAAKYHVFLNDYEFDFLLAEHFDDRSFGLGGVANAGGAIWRSDLVVTEVDNDSVISGMINFSYSWVAWNKNFSGIVEFYRNGFGIDNGDYGPANLNLNTELLQRLQRGELFTLGQHYLSTSATIELTPLWLLMPTVFVNLDDDSFMLQLLSQHDLQQNLQLLIAANFPMGDDGSEFGGIDSGVLGRPLSVDGSVFAQLGWYF
jgi:hypothetical protein